MSLRGPILLAALVAVAACGGDSGNGGQDPGETPEGDVLLRTSSFDPAELTVAPGTTVVWAWASALQHNITFNDGESSGNQSSGTYERTFAAAGTFPYHCTIHGTPTSGMRGVVTVSGTPAPDDGGSGGGGGGGGYPDDNTGGY